MADEAADAVGSADAFERVAVGDGGAVADPADEAADVAGGGGDRSAGEALGHAAAGFVDDADEAADVLARGGDIAEEEAARERGGVLHVADEAAGPLAAFDRRADGGASAHGRGARHPAHEGAGVGAAAHDRVHEPDVGDRSAGDVAEEACVVVAAGIDGQVGDRVSAPVERAGERRGVVAEGRPVRAREVDVRAEAVDAGRVLADRGELRAGRDQRAELGVDDAEVVDRERRRRGVRVGVGHVARPGEEEGRAAGDGRDRRRRAGQVGARAGDRAAGRFAGDRGAERHLAVHEAPREVGLREAVGLRPLAGRVEGGEAGAAVHRGSGKRVDADEVGGADVRQAIGDAEAVREGRATAILAAREAADFGGADGRARGVAARERRIAVVELPGEAADVAAARHVRERVAVGERGAVVDVSGEAADAVASGRRDGTAREALGDGDRIAGGVADEAAEALAAGSLHRTERVALFDCGGALRGADEPADVAVAAGDVADDGAARNRGVAHDLPYEASRPLARRRDVRARDGAAADGRALHVSREGADAVGAADDGVREVEVGDRRAGAESSEEAGAGVARLHGQIGDRVAVSVDRAGERRVFALAERRPGLAAEVDVRAEAVDAGGVGGDGREASAVGDGNAPDAPRRAVVVREEGRRVLARARVRARARPSTEE